MNRFAEVILPLPLPGTFTYAIPDDMAATLRDGHRVIVPFGKKKQYTGIVAGLTNIPPQGYEVKPILRLLDADPIIKRPQRQLWEWVADYYCSTVGEVMKAALPAGLKIESETFVQPVDDYEESPEAPLSERDIIVLQLLNHSDKRLTVGEIERKTGLTNVSATVSRLVDRGAVSVSEKLVERYRPQRIPSIRLVISEGETPQQAVSRAFDEVKGAPKQEKALLTLIELQGLNRRGQEPHHVSRADLMDRAGVTSAILTAMERKGIVELYKREINRFAFAGGPVIPLPSLTEAQAKALDQIHKGWLQKDVMLLHGVTSSGKTELYIHLLDFVMKLGRQALLLVPEIALTTQLTGRLQKVLGDKVIVYHSKFSDNERVDIWRRLLTTKEPCVVVGARSSVFLPFDNLGLVIVDEEHDASYKQQDPSPRYNGRDTAMVLARMHGAKTLLGSATPGIDTYYKATEAGRFGLVSLTERYGGAVLPRMELVDMTRARNRGEVKGPLAARTLTLAREALGANRQAIMFLNRRGYAPVAVCRQCAWIPKCDHCDVSLTYHKRLDKLVCHYCGAQYPLPLVCPACKMPAVEVAGYGTERLADNVAAYFPDSTVARMDLDTTRNKDAYSQIISDFSQRKAQVLVGTQMVTKGLDFDGVSMVGIVNSDSMLSMPDFRASERTFSMLEQVSGRAGRRKGENEPEPVVAIQTSKPAEELFGFLLQHDYLGFYKHEIEERRQFGYPPFVRLVYLFIKHPDPRHADDVAEVYGRELRAMLGDARVSSPHEPPVGRVQSLYIRRIMLKLEPQLSVSKLHRALDDLFVRLKGSGRASMKSAIVYCDVDPM